MALYDMAIEAAVRAHRKFKIDERTFLNSRERCALPSFLGEISGERVIAEIDRSEADTAHGHAVTLLEFGQKLRAGNCQPALFALLLDRSDLADFFDDSSEH
jgi:hypothetical protein